MRELATPAGIDHDYNFISAIERGVERTDRLLCDEKGIVTQKELREGPPDLNVSTRGRGRGRGGRMMGGERLNEQEKNVRRAQAAIGVNVERLPKGMARQKANTTSWSKKQKCIVWQVEWVREAGSTADQTINQPEDVNFEQWKGGEMTFDTVHHKILTTTPLSIAYANMIEELRRNKMTPEQRVEEKKRRAQEVADEKAEQAKRAKLEPVSVNVEHAKTEETPDIQPPTEETDAPGEESSKPELVDEQQPQLPQQQPQQKLPNDYAFYLLKARTPSNLPRVLIPLDYSHPLDLALKDKTIVEYPAIYVFPISQATLPDGYILEREFRKFTGGMDMDEEEVGSDDEEEEVVSDTSSSGTSEESSSEEESDDEEIADFGSQIEADRIVPGLAVREEIPENVDEEQL